VCENLESLPFTKTGETLNSHTHSKVLGILLSSQSPLACRTQDSVLGHFQSSLRDWSCWDRTPQDCVLGYSQPSLRDLTPRSSSHTHSLAQSCSISAHVRGREHGPSRDCSPLGGPDQVYFWAIVTFWSLANCCAICRCCAITLLPWAAASLTVWSCPEEASIWNWLRSCLWSLTMSLM
jgi:hypothetical protein